MKYILSIIFILLICSCFTSAQNVQKWESWQSNFFLTNGVALANVDQRNVGLHLWGDRGFGMELHYRNTWGTAIFTRSSNEAIWLGNYGSNQDQQQNYNPWMTLLNGNVGIGVSTPAEKLTIVGNNGNTYLGNTLFPNYNGLWLNGSTNALDYNILSSSSDNNLYINRPTGAGILFRQNNNTQMLIAYNGNVGIGTTNVNDATYKLFVEDGIRTRKIKVDQAVWPDYVFHNTYILRPLSEVEQYIQQHRHLPEVPSAEKVEKEGLDLGDNQATLLKKIEELTLYLIRQEKRIQELEKQLKAK